MTIQMKWFLYGVKVLLFASFFAAIGFAQSFSFGVKIGARLTDDLPTNAVHPISESRHYTVGPILEFRLWRGIGVEVDALYKRLGQSELFNDFYGDIFWRRDRSNSWEFPILAKYRFLRRHPSPYVSGGYAFRRIKGSGISQAFCCVPSNPTLTVSPYSTYYRNSSGLIVGGGVEFKVRLVRVSPEFRYTRWSNKAFSTYGPYGSYAESAQNQAEVLLGITWP